MGGYWQALLGISGYWAPGGSSEHQKPLTPDGRHWQHQKSMGTGWHQAPLGTGTAAGTRHHWAAPDTTEQWAAGTTMH